jgi:CspA family cold shock protein
MIVNQHATPALQLPPDRFLSCGHCGVTFVWTGWEQQQQAREPEHCPGCRHLLALTQRWGAVKWFDGRKGFGFITMSDGADIFVRRRDIKRGGRLRKGQLVSFRVKEGKNGPQAINVRVQKSE